MPFRRTILLTLAALAGAVAPAAAATDTTSVAIASGALSYSTPLTAGDFPGVTLSGSAQTVAADVAPYAVTDARGGSAGWNLTVEATQFSDGAGHTLPAGSLTMTLPPAPQTDALQNPLALPPVVSLSLDAIDGTGPQQIASAAAQPLAGAGIWTFTPLAGALRLRVPAAVAPGTYTSTLTTTLATGP